MNKFKVGDYVVMSNFAKNAIIKGNWQLFSRDNNPTDLVGIVKVVREMGNGFNFLVLWSNGQINYYRENHLELDNNYPSIESLL